MAAFGWILRLIAILLLLRLLMRFFAGIWQGMNGRPAAGPREKSQPRVGGKLVRDPQCGTHVLETRALRVGSGDSAVYFCSETCRDRWSATRQAV